MSAVSSTRYIFWNVRCIFSQDLAVANHTKESWAAQDQVGVSKTCRVMRLLDIRSFELKSAVHEVFDHVWKSLVHTDIDSRKIVICDSIQGMFLDAVQSWLY